MRAMSDVAKLPSGLRKQTTPRVPIFSKYAGHAGMSWSAAEARNGADMLEIMPANNARRPIMQPCIAVRFSIVGASAI